MFDTPDLGPLCAAPLVAIMVGFLFYGASRAISDFVASKIKKKLDWLKNILLVIAVSLVPIVCVGSAVLDIGASNPVPWFTPNTTNIVGKWVLTPGEIALLESSYHIPVLSHELVFNTDNTFSVSNIPFWGLRDQDNNEWVARYMSGSGTWRLEQVQDSQPVQWVLLVQFDELDGNKIGNSDEKRLARFFFMGHLPPYILRSVDSDLMFEFRKN